MSMVSIISSSTPTTSFFLLSFSLLFSFISVFPHSFLYLFSFPSFCFPSLCFSLFFLSILTYFFISSLFLLSVFLHSAFLFFLCLSSLVSLSLLSSFFLFSFSLLSSFFSVIPHSFFIPSLSLLFLFSFSLLFSFFIVLPHLFLYPFSLPSFCFPSLCFSLLSLSFLTHFFNKNTHRIIVYLAPTPPTKIKIFQKWHNSFFRNKKTHPPPSWGGVRWKITNATIHFINSIPESTIVNGKPVRQYIN